MPRLLEREEGADDALVAAHVDPDQRPDWTGVEGLSVDGKDRFADRRQMMRELHDGRPDPEPPPERPRLGRPPNAGRLNQTPLSEVAATGETAFPGFTVISTSVFEAMAGRSPLAYADLDPALDALQRGDCLRFALATSKVKNAGARLRKAAERRGLYLEVKSGPGYFAVRCTTKPRPARVTRPTIGSGS